MKVQSAKAKGRRFQQLIVQELLSAFPQLAPGDLRSTSMGAGGEDIQMSPLAQQVLPYSFEAKCQERVNVWSAIEQSRHNCGDRTPVVVIKKNQHLPYAVLPLSIFIKLIAQGTPSAVPGGSAPVAPLPRASPVQPPSPTTPPAPPPRAPVDESTGPALRIFRLATEILREAGRLERTDVGPGPGHGH
jgi:hypothetical protein